MGRAGNRPRRGRMIKRSADCSTSLRVPDSNGVVAGSGDDVAPIGRASNGPHHARMPLERIADCSTSLRIPDSNGAVVGSGDDVPTIGGATNGLQPLTMLLSSLARRTSL